MTPLDSLVAAVSPYVTAAVGLAGALIGGTITGSISLLVARQTREAAERAWIRDGRRQIYDRFLTNAQRLLIACEARRRAQDEGGEDAKDAVEQAHSSFWEVWGTVQTVAELPVVEAARVHAYRLWELKESLDSRSVLEPENFDAVARLTRQARHDTIDAMRTDLNLGGSVKPPDVYNPFLETELGPKYGSQLETAGKAADRVRPGARDPRLSGSRRAYADPDS